MSIAGAKNINYVIKRLQELEERLGGRKKKDSSKNKNTDEFHHAKVAILENIHKTRSKMNEFQTKKEKNVRKVDIPRLRMEIKNHMTELNQQLHTIDKIVKSQKKSKKITSIDKKNKAKLAGQFRAIYEDIKAEYEGRPITRAKNSTKDKNFKNDQEYLFNDLQNYNRGDRSNRKSNGTEDEGEKEILDGWKARDQQIENKLGDINILLDEIKMQAEQQGAEIRVVNELTTKAGKEVEKTTKQIVTENSRLKELVKKYRSPSKCCLDLTLIVFIVGLISVIVMLGKK